MSLRSAIVTTLIAALVLWFLVGAGDKGPERTEDGRLIVTYWEKWTGFEYEAMRKLVDRFNQSQDRIYVDMLSISGIDQKLLLATAGGNPPDLAGLWSANVPVFAEKNALTPLDDAIAQAGISKDDYIPLVWDLCTPHGFVWALPTTPSSLALHWNKRLFAEAGLDPTHPPQTLEELDAMSEKLTVVRLERDGQSVEVRYDDLTDAEKAAKDFRIVQTGHLPAVPGWYTALWFHWFNGQLISEDGKILPATQANLDTIRWYAHYGEKYGRDNVRQFNSSYGNFASPQDAFLSGKVAMVLQGVWENNFITKYAPGMSWGAAPFPAAAGSGIPYASLGESDVVVIPRGSQHPKAAFEFIRFMQRQENIEQLCLDQRKFSPLKKTSDRFIAEHPNPKIRLFIKLANSPYAFHTPLQASWDQYQSELQAMMDEVQNQKVDPKAAIQRLQKRMQPLYERSTKRWDRVREARLRQWRNDDTFSEKTP